MKVHLIYFSPGGTTKKTVRKIAEGVDASEIIEYDMLKKENRSKKYEFGKDDLVIMGMMTCTQLFGAPAEIFEAVQGNETPFVGVVMYGNGFYANSLKLMKREMEQKNFKMIAAAAFIGQMTYGTNVGKNRPDEKDQELQVKFGKHISEKITVRNDYSFNHKLKIDWPSNDVFNTVKSALFMMMPQSLIKVPAPFNSLEFTGNCVTCGKCENNCPMEAIDLSKKISNSKKCIGCLACVNNCSREGIVYTNSFMKKAAEYCEKNWTERREPELFF